MAYPTDLSDASWARIKHVLCAENSVGRSMTEENARKYADAVLYVQRTGCPWRYLPNDFNVKWNTVYKAFRRWTANGAWELLLECLRETIRKHHGRSPQPSAGIVDSCSVRASPLPGSRGFDGAKKTLGIKRHALVDTLGLLLALTITPANKHDGHAAIELLALARVRLQRLTHIWADKGYRGKALAAAAAALNFTLEIVCGPKEPGVFRVQPRRWVVERTFAWMYRSRRLVRQYEQLTETHAGFAVLSQVHLCLRRLEDLDSLAA